MTHYPKYVLPFAFCVCLLCRYEVGCSDICRDEIEVACRRNNGHLFLVWLDNVVFSSESSLMQLSKNNFSSKTTTAWSPTISIGSVSVSSTCPKKRHIASYVDDLLACNSKGRWFIRPKLLSLDSNQCVFVYKVLTGVLPAFKWLHLKEHLTKCWPNVFGGMCFCKWKTPHLGDRHWWLPSTSTIHQAIVIGMSVPLFRWLLDFQEILVQMKLMRLHFFWTSPWNGTSWHNIGTALLGMR